MAENDKSSINIDGNVQGGMVNIGGNQTVHGAVTVNIRDMSQSINSIPNVSASEIEQIQTLIEQLREALRNVPVAHQKDAERIAKRVEELVDEVSEEEVDTDAVESKANLLKKAAENLREAMPIVTQIALNLIVQISNMGS